MLTSLRPTMIFSLSFSGHVEITNRASIACSAAQNHAMAFSPSKLTSLQDPRETEHSFSMMSVTTMCFAFPAVARDWALPIFLRAQAADRAVIQSLFSCESAERVGKGRVSLVF